MMTLVTGLLGAGKTLNTIHMVMKEKPDHGDIYYAGITDLTLPWKEVSYDQLQDWQSFPDGSVFVVDEADRWLPQRGNNPKVPEFIRELARHRHRGMDFYIVTQMPKFIDHFARNLCNRHLHFERAFNFEGSKLLEWQKPQDDPNDYHARRDATSTRKKFPKEVFDLYRSAEIHTHKPRVPKKLVLLGIGVLVVIALALNLANSLQEQGPGQGVEEGVSPSELERLTEFYSGSVVRDPGEVLDQEAYIKSWEPRIANLPHTAPVYDGLTEVKTFPRPNCIYSHRTAECTCYTQQATPMEVEYEFCRAVVANGWFNPYREEVVEQVAEGGDGGVRITPPIGAPENAVRITYPDGNLNAPPEIEPVEPAWARNDRPGRAYRNPRSVPTFPSQPGVAGSPR
ncbi:MAG: zonular occludens toxin domain-containing protein [Pseudomonadota bacterium]